MAKVKVTQLKSTIAFNKSQKVVLLSLGLRRIGHSIVADDTASTRGKILKVRHLVKVEPAN
jgi:large subunit ribosomal protein L30